MKDLPITAEKIMIIGIQQCRKKQTVFPLNYKKN
jgi:hypothetical protein